VMLSVVTIFPVITYENNVLKSYLAVSSVLSAFMQAMEDCILYT